MIDTLPVESLFPAVFLSLSVFLFLMAVKKESSSSSEDMSKLLTLSMILTSDMVPVKKKCKEKQRRATVVFVGGTQHASTFRGCPINKN